MRNGVSLAYVHEGVGGTPIVLIHGYPETKRIWWRNIAPLADAGFEVIAPGPARLRRLRPRARRLLRRHRVLARPVRARPRRPRARALRGRGRRPRRRHPLRPRAPLPRVRGPHLRVQHARDPARRPLRGGRHPARRRPRHPADGRLLPPPGPGARGAHRRARHARPPPRLGGRHVRAPPVGRARALHRRRRRLHDRAVRRRRAAARELGQLRDRVRQPGHGGRAQAVRAVPAAGAGAVRPRRQRGARLVPRPGPPRLPDCVGPFVVPDAGHFLQWEQADVLNRALAHFAADTNAALTAQPPRSRAQPGT